MHAPVSRPSRTSTTRLTLAGPSDLPAQRLVTPPRMVLEVARAIVVVLPLVSLLLLIVPWQQSATGSGRVMAWSPDHRPQVVEAPVEGRIAEWLVREGDRVIAGQPLVLLEDNDADWLSRLEGQRDAGVTGVAAFTEQVRRYEDKLTAERASLDLAMAEYVAKIAGLVQKQTGERAARDTADLNEQRQRALFDSGIRSARSWELAKLELDKAQAALSARDEQIAATQQAKAKARAQAQSKIATVEADAEAARAKLATASQKQLELDGDFARQARQRVLAPVDGVVQVLHGGPGGEQVKRADRLVTLVPETNDRAVELSVDGNDMPLVEEGAEVRLLFEGWPALQFVGLPGASGGTFEGQVAWIDPAADDEGKFRVVVVPQGGQPWPDAAVLRQGVRAKGFVLLGQVKLGYELWRQINGFPPLPRVDKKAPTLPSGKKPRAPASLK
ncbi:MAG: HlyD family efflux transporter periplasmic adaptor subunit [Proteobacteria bacterium]|nr:HlyD family efflux transporter periplasmic adaptor subunit [Pseudomonadota bacterium]